MRPSLVFFENRKRCPNFGKKTLIVSIFGLNFSFEMQFYQYLGEKTPKFYPANIDWLLQSNGSIGRFDCFINQKDARRSVFKRFKTLPERSHSQDVTATVPSIFRKTERIGYAQLLHCFNACGIVCALSGMSRTLHLLFH